MMFYSSHYLKSSPPPNTLPHPTLFHCREKEGEEREIEMRTERCGEAKRKRQQKKKNLFVIVIVLDEVDVVFLFKQLCLSLSPLSLHRLVNILHHRMIIAAIELIF